MSKYLDATLEAIRNSTFQAIQNPNSVNTRRKERRAKIAEFDNIVKNKFEAEQNSFKGKFNSPLDLLNYLQQYRKSDFSLDRKPDVKKMRTQNCCLTIHSAVEFEAIKEALQKYFPNRIEFTKSNSIKMARNYTIMQGWGIRYTAKKHPELIILSFVGQWRIQYRGAHSPKEYGKQSWRELNNECKKAGISLKEIAVDGTFEELKHKKKQEVPKPRIEVLDGAFSDIELPNVHHVDIHSAHPYYIAKKFPQLEPVINKWYNLRHDEVIGEKMKQRLVNISGYSQSEHCGFKYYKMAQAAIEGTNSRIEEIIAELKQHGRLPLLVNTDGVWYQGEVYHFQDEGPNLGQLHTDHTNCTLRIKSAGAYEYIEDGKYNVAMRGKYSFELVKPREQWQWGDIYQAGHLFDWTFNDQEEKFELLLSREDWRQQEEII